MKEFSISESADIFAQIHGRTAPAPGSGAGTLSALRQIIDDARDVRAMAERSQANRAQEMAEKCAFIISNAECVIELVAPNTKESSDA